MMMMATRKSRRHRRSSGWRLSILAVVGLSVVVEGNNNNWWKPGPGVNWDWRLAGLPRVSAGVDMYNVDLFDMTATQIQDLRDADVVVVCSFSAGTYEEYREDEENFPRSALGNRREDSEGEWWINIDDEGILKVMEERLDLALEKGCDGVEPDSVEAYTLGVEVTDWNITADDQLTYNRWLADEAHARNLSVGLMNDVDQAAELEPSFDWAINTDCYTLGLCDAYDAFVGQGKAVVAAEFSVEDLLLCNSTYAESIDFIVKGVELDAQRCSCGFPSTNVECQSLLAANSPTEEPSRGGLTDGDTHSSADNETGAEGTPTWVIVTAIAVMVLIAMVACGAYAWWKRLKRLRGWGSATSAGVDDFCS